MSILKKMFKNQNNVYANDKMIDAAIQKAILINIDEKEILVMIKRLSPEIKEETILEKIKAYS